MAKPRILLGFTYSMGHLVDTAFDSGVRLILPRAAAYLGADLGLEVVDLPHFGSKAQSAKAFAKLVKKHKIDAFWPLSSSSSDLTHLDGLTRATIHPVCKHLSYQAINDKVTFDAWLKDDPYRPEGVETVGAMKTMMEIYARLKKGQRVCCKPPRGVNGGGFWEIDPNANLLADPVARKIRPEVFESELRKFEAENGMDRFLVMEVLPGRELSIDVLCVNGEAYKWMIREKVSPSKQIARSNHEIMDHVRYLVKAFRLHGIISVQYMYDKFGRIKILEINLRPSGGCLAYGPTIFESAGTSDLLTDWLQYMAGIIKPRDIKQWEGEHTYKTPTVAVMV